MFDGDLTLSVNEGNPVDHTGDFDTGGRASSPLRRPLPEETTGTTTDDFLDFAHDFAMEAPNGSYYQSVGDGITRQLTGFNKSEIKEGFQRAWQKDKKLGKILGGAKMSIRCIGFAIGTAVNLASRIVTIPLALGFGVLSAVGQFIFTPKKSFKNPKEVLTNTFTWGLAGGVVVGSSIGAIGMKLSKTMVGIKLDRTEEGDTVDVFDRSAIDNALPAMVGAGAGAGVACLYPAMWQLPFRTGD